MENKSSNANDGCKLPLFGAFCNHYRGQPARKLREWGCNYHNSYFVPDLNLNYVQTILETPKVEIFEISGGDELNIPNFFIDSWTQVPRFSCSIFRSLDVHVTIRQATMIQPAKPRPVLVVQVEFLRLSPPPKRLYKWWCSPSPENLSEDSELGNPWIF